MPTRHLCLFSRPSLDTPDSGFLCSNGLNLHSLLPQVSPSKGVPQAGLQTLWTVGSPTVEDGTGDHKKGEQIVGWVGTRGRGPGADLPHSRIFHHKL